MIPFKLGENSFLVPARWEDITVKQWFQLREIPADDYCGILSILSGVSRETWFNAREIDVVEKIIPLLDWMGVPTDLSRYPIPEKIMIGGEIVSVPKDIKLKTFGAKLTYEKNLKDYTNDKGEVSIDFMPIALSIYFCPEPFNDKAAAALLDDIGNMPISEAYPISAFFLNSLRPSSNQNQKLFQANTKRISVEPE